MSQALCEGTSHTQCLSALVLGCLHCFQLVFLLELSLGTSFLFSCFPSFQTPRFPVQGIYLPIFMFCPMKYVKMVGPLSTCGCDCLEMKLGFFSDEVILTWNRLAQWPATVMVTRNYPCDRIGKQDTQSCLVCEGTSGRTVGRRLSLRMDKPFQSGSGT